MALTLNQMRAISILNESHCVRKGGKTMNGNRKTIGLIMILILMTNLFLTSCGGKKEESQAAPGTQTTQPEQSEPPQTEIPTPATPQSTESGSEGDFENWQPFNIEPGQYFKYMTKVTQADGKIKEGWFTLKVTGESDGQVTIESEGESGTDKFSFSTTDDKDNVFSSVMMSYMMNPASQHVFMTIYSPFMGGGAWLMGMSQGKVKVGNKWSYTADGQSVTNEVVEMREYVGINGYYMRYLVNDELQSEVCMSPKFPLALMSSVKMDDMFFESELVEYEED